MSVKLQRLLRAPGAGLLSASVAGSELPLRLKKFFTSESLKNWSQHLSKNFEKSCAAPFSILGVPSDSGGGICRGAAHGPLALREVFYKKNPSWAKRDLGDIPCIPQLVHDSMLNGRQLESSGKSLWGDDYVFGRAVSPLNITEEFLVETWQQHKNFRPLVLGGDHSISGAVFAALARTQKLEKLAVLHIDAHTDLLESRFGVEHCFGTWTAHALKSFKDPSVWVQIGIRSSGRDKKHWESHYGLQQYWSPELARGGAKFWAEKLLAHWKSRGCEKLYVTNDIDGTDERYVPSTGTPAEKGLKPLWLKSLITELSRGLPLIGADIMEVAPVLGSPADARLTLKTALSYAEALNWH